MKVNFHFSFIPGLGDSFPPSYLNDSLINDAKSELESRCKRRGATIHGEPSHSDWDIFEEPYTRKKVYSIIFQAEVEGINANVNVPLEKIYIRQES